MPRYHWKVNYLCDKTAILGLWNLSEIFSWNLALKLGHSYNTETQRPEKCPHVLGAYSIQCSMSLSQRRMRLAKYIAATIFETTNEIAREKNLKQTMISTASQNSCWIATQKKKKNWSNSQDPHHAPHRLNRQLWGREATILPHELWIWAMVFGGHWSGTGYSLKIFTGMIFHLTLLFWHGCQHLNNPSIVFTSNSSAH